MEWRNSGSRGRHWSRQLSAMTTRQFAPITSYFRIAKDIRQSRLLRGQPDRPRRSHDRAQEKDKWINCTEVQWVVYDDRLATCDAWSHVLRH